MTEAKRGRGRPRKLPMTEGAPAAPPAPAGLSAAPEPTLADMIATEIPVAPSPAAPLREEPRAADVRAEAPRAEDPRAEAERLANEWFGHLDSLGPHKDKYYVDPTKIPDGWSYEWRTYSVVGKENPQYHVQLQRAAWRPVMTSRHPELMPKGHEGVVLVDGMMLMERPRAITEFQQQRDRREANAPIENIRAKLSGAPANQFPRDSDARTAPRIKTEFGPMDIPAAKA